jgi:flagella basal body P-ring formation protein FlgA
MHLIRPLAAATPLLRAQLAPDPIVQKGEAVTLVARQGGMEIRAPGRALADAAPGGRLRVQNVNSLKVVEGRADSSGVVTVDP